MVWRVRENSSIRALASRKSPEICGEFRSRSSAVRLVEPATWPTNSAPEATFSLSNAFILSRVSEAREDAVFVRPSAACCAVCCALSASFDTMLLSPPVRSGEAADCVPDLDGDGDAPFPGAATVRKLVLARGDSGMFSFAIWKSLSADDGQSSALNK